MIARMFNGILQPPRFDFWFWALVLWSFFVPYLYESAHVKTCDEQHRVHFTEIDNVFSGNAVEYECFRVESTRR